MKKLAAIVLAFGCWLAAGSLGAATAAVQPSAFSNCRNPVTAGNGEVPVYVYLEAIDRGKLTSSISLPLRWYKPKGYVQTGWARSNCWTTNLFPKRRLPRTLCIVARYGFRSLLTGGECQQWRWQGDRRIMVFRLVKE